MIQIVLASMGLGAILTWFAVTINYSRHPARRHKAPKKPLPSLTKYVVFSISVVIIYTICEFIVSTITNIHHDVLTGCAYGFFAGEVIVSAMIKIFKLKEEDNGNV